MKHLKNKAGHIIVLLLLSVLLHGIVYEKF